MVLKFTTTTDIFTDIEHITTVFFIQKKVILNQLLNILEYVNLIGCAIIVNTHVRIVIYL